MKSLRIKKIRQLYDEASRQWFDIYTAPGVGGEFSHRRTSALRAQHPQIPKSPPRPRGDHRGYQERR